MHFLMQRPEGRGLGLAFNHLASDEFALFSGQGKRRASDRLPIILHMPCLNQQSTLIHQPKDDARTALRDADARINNIWEEEGSLEYAALQTLTCVLSVIDYRWSGRERGLSWMHFNFCKHVCDRRGRSSYLPWLLHYLRVRASASFMMISALYWYWWTPRPLPLTPYSPRVPPYVLSDSPSMISANVAVALSHTHSHLPISPSPMPTVTMPPLDQALSSVSFLVHKMALLVLNWWNRGCH